MLWPVTGKLGRGRRGGYKASTGGGTLRLLGCGFGEFFFFFRYLGPRGFLPVGPEDFLPGPSPIFLSWGLPREELMIQVGVEMHRQNLGAQGRKHGSVEYALCARGFMYAGCFNSFFSSRNQVLFPFI